MNNVRTVSDTKRTFYSLHTRPVNTIYRRVVEEMMVEMHLLSVNVDFSYNPIYALGVVTAFDRFMQGYQPEHDKESIFSALCKSVESDPQQYRQDAEKAQAIAKDISSSELISWLSRKNLANRNGEFEEVLVAISNNPNFKYSRLFAIGIFTLLETANPEIVKDEKQRNEAFMEIAKGLQIADDKITKDLDLYRSNLDKMAQALIVMEDMLKADRKKREQRSSQKTNTSTPSSSTSES